MTDSLKVRGDPASQARSVPESERMPPGVPSGQRPERTEEFDACVEEIRRRYMANSSDVVYALVDRLRRRLGLASTSVRAMALAGLIGIGIRLAVVLLVTALAGQWTGLPWGRWMVVILFFGLMDAGGPLMAPPSDVPLGPRLRRIADDWTPLIPAISRESDLRELAAFTRRWIRLPVAVGAGVVVATLMLGASWLVSPAGMSGLPAGSIVLLCTGALRIRRGHCLLGEPDQLGTSGT